MSRIETIAPANVEELRQVVEAAIADRTPLEVVGGGTRHGIGHPGRNVTQIATRAFAGIIDYDPAELVITLGVGTPLAEVEALLASQGQMLAFDPFDFARLTGELSRRSTIGGVVASGFAGSRRVSAGSVRDHLLGFTAVSGNAEIFKAGGRVVKNVTGFDLPKLLTGSWGQLAVLTQLTLKVLPRPRTALTLQLSGLDDARALAVLMRAMRSQASVAAAAYIPDRSVGESQTLLRLEGFGASVEARAKLLSRVLDHFGEPQQVTAQMADALWSRIGCARIWDTDPQSETLWRFCVPATAALQIVAAIREQQGRCFVDWGGGLVWGHLPATSDASALRELAERAAGHVMLVSAPAAYRARVPALHPEPPGVAALSARVRAAFDATSILDPDRFVIRAE